MVVPCDGDGDGGGSMLFVAKAQAMAGRTSRYYVSMATEPQKASNTARRTGNVDILSSVICQSIIL
jgi:hypothetical protein